MKILLIEDDLEFAELIKNFLGDRNITTLICDDPYLALVTNLDNYDLVLLDLGLPGIDGLEVCKKFREKSNIPIIISTARCSTTDKVLGLEMGADDYLPKPYDPDELYARIKSLIRRYKTTTQNTTEQRHFIADTNTRDVRYKDRPLFLTMAEFAVFETMIHNFDGVSSKEQLLSSCENIGLYSANSLEMLISKIRKKIAVYSDKKHIISSRGIGYRVVE